MGFLQFATVLLLILTAVFRTSAQRLEWVEPVNGLLVPPGSKFRVWFKVNPPMKYDANARVGLLFPNDADNNDISSIRLLRNVVEKKPGQTQNTQVFCVEFNLPNDATESNDAYKLRVVLRFLPNKDADRYVVYFFDRNIYVRKNADRPREDSCANVSGASSLLIPPEQQWRIVLSGAGWLAMGALMEL
ncbi:uncharacterized protein VTP21DRAFT_3333 [Calcarisporiella thermophila]|uniref:uncharacterized protein n=1 Tax=Calcarisporiella thermophila TaxID=911321 RepID=UPI00374239DE